jgi:hypothetical protein
MRTGFIGASSPIAFDYKVFRKKGKGYPNPILEAPLGLFVMYDELLFLDPVVCPYNMSELEYVRFVSDTKDVSEYIEIFEGKEIPHVGTHYPWKDWQHIAMTIAPFATIGNHSAVRFHKDWPFPDSRSPKNVILDQVIAQAEKAEPITNTLTDDWLLANVKRVMGLSLTQIALHSKIPNFQSPEGPYVEFIDEVRASRQVKAFRKKVEEVCGEDKIRDVKEATLTLEEDFNSIRNQALVEKAGIGPVYESAASITLSGASEFVRKIPLLGTVVGLTIDVKDAIQGVRDRKRRGWAALLAEIEESLERANKKSKQKRP